MAALNLNAVAATKSAVVTGHVHFAHRGAFTRVDVIDLSAVASAGGHNVAMPLPFEGLHFVVDGARGTFAVWSSRSPRYYSGRLKTNRSAFQVANVTSALSPLTQFSLLSISLNLIGDQTSNGHPVSAFEFEAKTRKRGAATATDVTGHVDLGDDVSGFPIHADATITSGSAAKVTIAMDVTALSASAPPLSAFAPPKGYKRTGHIADVLSAHP